MRRSRAWTERSSRIRERLAADPGSASLELLTVGILLLVPTVYLVVALSALQSAAFAVEGAARQGSRVFAQADSVAEAREALERAVTVTLADYGLDAGAADVAVSCRPEPRDCLVAHGLVTVTVGARVPLPLLPPVIDAALPGSVPLSAASTEQVSRFRGSR